MSLISYAGDATVKKNKKKKKKKKKKKIVYCVPRAQSGLF